MKILLIALSLLYVVSAHAEIECKIRIGDDVATTKKREGGGAATRYEAKIGHYELTVMERSLNPNKTGQLEVAIKNDPKDILFAYDSALVPYSSSEEMPNEQSNSLFQFKGVEMRILCLRLETFADDELLFYRESF